MSESEERVVYGCLPHRASLWLTRMFTFGCGTCLGHAAGLGILPLHSALRSAHRSHRADKQTDRQTDRELKSSSFHWSRVEYSRARCECGREVALFPARYLNSKKWQHPHLNVSTNYYDIMLYKEFPSRFEAEFTSKRDRRISPVVGISSCRNESNLGGGGGRSRTLYPGTIHRLLETISAVRMSMSGRTLAMSS